MKITGLLIKTENGVVKAEQIALTVLIIVMVTLSFSQVVLRLFFSKGILWADPFLRYLTVWVGFLGAGLCAYYGKHFALDISEKLFRGKLKKIVTAVSSFFASVTLLLLTIAASKFFAMEIEAGSKLFSIGAYRVPSYLMEFMIPLGFALIFFHTAMSLIRPHNKEL